MFGLSKKRDCILGIFLVGSNKSLKTDKFEKDLYQNPDYRHYRSLLNIKRGEYEVAKGSFEWIIDDALINDTGVHNTQLYKKLYDIADSKLAKDYKGYGEDLVNALTSAVMCIYMSIADSLKEDKPGAISMVVQVPRYVTMLIDKDGRKHNSVNWIIDNNSFVHSIHEVFTDAANTYGYNGNVITLLRWTEM